ncbi:MAG: hypothetical protein KAT43_05435 [Nanoarchaeota archaeon]|nr:hypothetical protein [Nanoarchaeota archaeon]
MSRDDEMRIDGYSYSKDSAEYDEYQRRLIKIRDEIRKLHHERERIEKYNARRKKLEEMGVWQEVIAMVHDYQVLFMDPEDLVYDTLYLLKCVSISIASVAEREAMSARGVPVTNFAYSIDWPEDPIARLEYTFFIDSRRNEARRRFISNYFRQQLGELEKQATANPQAPGDLEKKLKVAQPHRIAAAR